MRNVNWVQLGALTACMLGGGATLAGCSSQNRDLGEAVRSPGEAGSGPIANEPGESAGSGQGASGGADAGSGQATSGAAGEGQSVLGTYVGYVEQWTLPSGHDEITIVLTQANEDTVKGTAKFGRGEASPGKAIEGGLSWLDAPIEGFEYTLVKGISRRAPPPFRARHG